MIAQYKLGTGSEVKVCDTSRTITNVIYKYVHFIPSFFYGVFNGRGDTKTKGVFGRGLFSTPPRSLVGRSASLLWQELTLARATSCESQGPCFREGSARVGVRTPCVPSAAAPRDTQASRRSLARHYVVLLGRWGEANSQRREDTWPRRWGTNRGRVFRCSGGRVRIIAESVGAPREGAALVCFQSAFGCKRRRRHDGR